MIKIGNIYEFTEGPIIILGYDKEHGWICMAWYGPKWVVIQLWKELEDKLLKMEPVFDMDNYEFKKVKSDELFLDKKKVLN